MLATPTRIIVDGCSIEWIEPTIKCSFYVYLLIMHQSIWLAILINLTLSCLPPLHYCYQYCSVLTNSPFLLFPFLLGWLLLLGIHHVIVIDLHCFVSLFLVSFSPLLLILPICSPFRFVGMLHVSRILSPFPWQYPSPHSICLTYSLYNTSYLIKFILLQLFQNIQITKGILIQITEGIEYR